MIILTIISILLNIIIGIVTLVIRSLLKNASDKTSETVTLILQALQDELAAAGIQRELFDLVPNRDKLIKEALHTYTDVAPIKPATPRAPSRPVSASSSNERAESLSAPILQSTYPSSTVDPPTN